VNFYSRRVGGTIEIRGRFTLGTTTATEARVTLGYNGTDSNITSSNTVLTSLMLSGTMVFTTNVAAAYYILMEPNVGYFTFSIQAAANNGLTKANGNIITTTGNSISLICSVPVDSFP
jgi:hypothetical protein